MFFAPIVSTSKKTSKTLRKKAISIILGTNLPSRLQNIESDAQILVINPEAIRQFYMNHDQYIKHLKLFGLSKELSQNGLVLAEGKMWKRNRKLISMAFQYELFKDIIEYPKRK